MGRGKSKSLEATDKDILFKSNLSGKKRETKESLEVPDNIENLSEDEKRKIIFDNPSSIKELALQAYEEIQGLSYKDNPSLKELQEEASEMLENTLGLDVDAHAWEQEKVHGSKNLLLNIPELDVELVYCPDGIVRTIGYYTGSRFDDRQHYNPIKNLSDLGQAIKFSKK